MLRLTRNYRRCMSCHNLCQQVTNRSAAVRRMTSSTPRGQTDSSHIAIGVGLLAVSGALMYKSLKHTATDIFPVIPNLEEKEVKADKKPVEIPEASISSEEPVKDEEIVVSEEPEVVSAENSSEPEVVIKKVVQEEPKKLPEAVPYVIVGGGTAAHAACRAIKKNDPNAKILVIGSEKILPYMRPPLSKEMWFDQKSDVSTSLTYKAWNGKERSVFFEDNSYYTDVYDLNKEGGVAVLTGTKVMSVDAPGHSVTLESGEKIKYNKLLLATGGRPKQHPAFENLREEHTTLFRKVEDFQKLDSILKNVKNVLVLGGGFLGSELACALAAAGKEKNMQITQAYNEDGNMAKVLPHYLSEWTTKKVNREGVKTLANHGIQSASFEDGKVNVVFKNGERMSTDHVIVCVGLDANVELADSSGLEVDDRHGGFRVNSELEARSDIWVAGDAASFYDINLGRRRVEHHDHAVVSGRLAGENMTGAKKAYHHQSMFWSDLGPEVGYEAIGLVDSSLPTVGVWAKATPQDTPKAASEATGETIRSEANTNDVTSSPTPATTTLVEQQHSEEFGKGVVFYKQGKRVVGVLLWNIFGQMPVARKLISDAQEHEDMNKVAKLFKIHVS